MYLGGVGVCSKMYELVPVYLMICHVVSEVCYYRFVDMFHLAGCLWTISSHRHRLDAKTESGCCKKFQYDLRSVFGQQIR